MERLAREEPEHPLVQAADTSDPFLDMLGAKGAESEAAVRQTMENLKGQLTILAISHNRAMVQAADYVYQMEAGGARLLNEQDQSILIK